MGYSNTGQNTGHEEKNLTTETQPPRINFKLTIRFQMKKKRMYQNNSRSNLSFDSVLFDFSLVYVYELINFQCDDRRRFDKRAYLATIFSYKKFGISVATKA